MAPVTRLSWDDSEAVQIPAAESFGQCCGIVFKGEGGGEGSGSFVVGGRCRFGVRGSSKRLVVGSGSSRLVSELDEFGLLTFIGSRVRWTSGALGFSSTGFSVINSVSAVNFFTRITPQIKAYAIEHDTRMYRDQLVASANCCAIQIVLAFLDLTTTVAVICRWRRGAIIVSRSITTVEMVIMTTRGQNGGRVPVLATFKIGANTRFGTIDWLAGLRTIDETKVRVEAVDERAAFTADTEWHEVRSDSEAVNVGWERVGMTGNNDGEEDGDHGNHGESLRQDVSESSETSHFPTRVCRRFDLQFGFMIE